MAVSNHPCDGTERTLPNTPLLTFIRESLPGKHLQINLRPRRQTRTG